MPSKVRLLCDDPFLQFPDLGLSPGMLGSHFPEET